MCIVSLRLALSQFALTFLSHWDAVMCERDMHGALPIKSFPWSSLVPRSQNCPSSRSAVMSMMRLEIDAVTCEVVCEL